VYEGVIVQDHRVLRAELEADNGAPLHGPLLKREKRQALGNLVQVTNDRETRGTRGKIRGAGAGEEQAPHNQRDERQGGNRGDGGSLLGHIVSLLLVPLHRSPIKLLDTSLYIANYTLILRLGI
jgi:hypothetical protein